jgi:transposase InsO family protein
VQRYEREHPGDLIDIDVKQQGRSAGVGYDRVHVAIDDTTRLASVEVLADEQQATAIGFLCRAVAWFNSQGVECQQVMSDNGPASLSRSIAKAYQALGLKHIRTRTYTPRTNGKAERYGLRPTTSTFRPSAGNGPTGCPSRTPRNATVGGPATCRSITGLGSTQPSATAHLSSGSMSCSADQLAETQHLVNDPERNHG